MGNTESAGPHHLPRQYSTTNFLNRPITEIHTHSGNTPGFEYSMSCMQGWRAHMEDAHILEGAMFGQDGWGFFSVLDGHAGKLVAMHSEKTLVPRVTLEVGPVRGSLCSILDALRRAFIYHDLSLSQDFDVLKSRSGTTCTSILVTPTHAIFANLGDSRALLVRDGRLVFATADHKPSNAIESKRIRAAGGTVIMDRVDGGLAVSRAFGDFDYKMRSDLPAIAQKVSPDPDTFAVPRVAGSEEFLVLACDGVWDVMTSVAAVKFVHTVLTKSGFTSAGATAATQALVQRALSQGSRDNISAIVVVLRPDTVPPPPPQSDLDLMSDLASAVAANVVQEAVHFLLTHRGSSVLPPMAVRNRMVDAAMGIATGPPTARGSGSGSDVGSGGGVSGGADSSAGMLSAPKMDCINENDPDHDTTTTTATATTTTTPPIHPTQPPKQIPATTTTTTATFATSAASRESTSDEEHFDGFPSEDTLGDSTICCDGVTSHTNSSINLLSFSFTPPTTTTTSTSTPTTPSYLQTTSASAETINSSVAGITLTESSTTVDDENNGGGDNDNGGEVGQVHDDDVGDDDMLEPE